MRYCRTYQVCPLEGPNGMVVREDHPQVNVLCCTGTLHMYHSLSSHVMTADKWSACEEPVELMSLLLKITMLPSTSLLQRAATRALASPPFTCDQQRLPHLSFSSQIHTKFIQQGSPERLTSMSRKKASLMRGSSMRLTRNPGRSWETHVCMPRCLDRASVAANTCVHAPPICLANPSRHRPPFLWLLDACMHSRTCVLRVSCLRLIYSRP